jgi:hypothetical protein
MCVCVCVNYKYKSLVPGDGEHAFVLGPSYINNISSSPIMLTSNAADTYLDLAPSSEKNVVRITLFHLHLLCASRAHADKGVKRKKQRKRGRGLACSVFSFFCQEPRAFVLCL